MRLGAVPGPFSATRGGGAQRSRGWPAGAATRHGGPGAAHALLEADEDTLLARLVELLRLALESASASSETERGRHEIVQQLLHNLTMPRSAQGGFNSTGSGLP